MGGNSVQRVDDQKAAVLSAGDLPDAFILRGLVTDEEVASYGAAGTFIKLQDYITPEIMPNLAGYLEEHPDWKTAITAPDGNIYSLPSIDATAYTADSIPYVNKDWAAQVMQDLDLTQPMDLETFEALLTAFKIRIRTAMGRPMRSHGLWGETASIFSAGAAVSVSLIPTPHRTILPICIWTATQ